MPSSILPVAARVATARYETRHWTRVALALLLFTALFQVLARTDVVMLGVLLDTRAAGIYAIAAQASQLVFLGLSAVNTIAAPMISALYWQHRHDELQRVVRLAAIGILLTAVPALLVLVVFGRPILRLFGALFDRGYAALVILCAGQLIHALSGSVGFLMSMTGHQKQAAGIVGMAVVLNVVLNFLLIPPLGMVGAAVASATATAAWNLVMLVYVWRHLRINPTVVPLEMLSK